MRQNRFSKERGWLLEEKYQGKVTKAAQKDLARIKAGEPVDYLIGFVEFAGVKIDLSKRPLIPRPETEYWTLQAISKLKNQKSKKTKCLDIFAGSGCVGIAVLKHISRVHVDFTEKEQKFLKQIRLNLKKNNIDASRARVIQSNVFSRVEGEYDYIFANPPYVATKRWKSVQASVKKYEPKNALRAGKDGLRYIRKFLEKAKTYLKPGGTIYMEFDSPQKQEMDRLLKKYGYSFWQFHKDQYKKWRFVVILN